MNKSISKQIAILSIDLTYNYIQEINDPVLVVNPIFNPDSYFLSLPLYIDKKLMIDISSNCQYLKNKDLSLSESFSPSIYQFLPKNIPAVAPTGNVFFYFTDISQSELPSVCEKSSYFIPQREILISKILNSLLIN